MQGAEGKHKVQMWASLTSQNASCSCGDGFESMGRDESSKSAAKAWKTKHEEEHS